jgi:nitrile hydratase beta subunit
MNGVHDMGGMQDMGPVEAEPNEPVFHHPWEGRVFAVRRAMGAWRKWNIDASRFAVELVPPVDYLRMTYYERQFVAFLEMLVERKFVTPAEVESGVPAASTPVVTPALTVEKAQSLIAKGVPAKRDLSIAPRFQPGQRIRTCNLNPTTHTRLPRYARDKSGSIARDHGVFVFPDTNAIFLGEHPQHLYSVRFSARELWGAQAAPNDSVYLDMWDAYLEPT